jgi:predicted lipoprotein with Yx(FWY)xxD motif
VLETASSSHGQILVSAKDHHTVYLFTQDHGTVSACASPPCSVSWPALKAPPGHLTGGAGVDSSKISVAHGQIAYNGHLLYEYSGDSAPGQTNGAGVPDWYPISPAGNAA